MPDLVDAAIAATEQPLTWQQANVRVQLQSGRNILVGFPVDITPIEMLDFISKLPALPAALPRPGNGRIIVPQ